MKKTMKACLLSLCTGLSLFLGIQHTNAQVMINTNAEDNLQSYCIPVKAANSTQFLIPQNNEYGNTKFVVYNNKFERVRDLDVSNIVSGKFELGKTYFVNLMDPNYDTRSLIATQTLFNDDDLYEFIIYQDTSYEYISRKTHNIKIVNEKGKIIREFSDPEANLFLNVCRVPENEKNYIVVYHRYPDSKKICEGDSCWYDPTYVKKDDCWKIYEIDASTSSVREVQSMPISIKPRAARKSETITMTLPQKNSTRQVVLTAADGKQIADYKLAAGEHKLHINTSSMPQGVNIYSVYENGTKVDSGKILIH